MTKENKMTAKYSFRDLAKEAKQVVMIPCIYDCASARAAELSGAQATLLSGGELGESMGILEPMLTTDEVVHAVEKICSFSYLPCMIDVGAGYDTPLNAFFTTKRMVKAGAMAILLGNERGQTWDDYEPILKATIEACKGTECIVVARRNGMIDTPEALEECIVNLTKSMELGAEATMACGLCRTPEVKRLSKIIGERVPGWKVYPDQNSVDGKPDVVNEEIWNYGYKMISYHYMMKVAMEAMWRYGMVNLKAGNNVSSNELRFPNNMKGHSALGTFPMQDLFDLEEKFTGIHREFKIPGSMKGRENG
jgi:methylisocitrate lyase